MSWPYDLATLAQWLGVPAPPQPVQVLHASTDTRTLTPGALFFALRGPNFDAESFVAEAFARGAAAAVCTRPHPEGPCLVVDDAHAALTQVARQHRTRHPVPMFAVTGSVGKTTVKDFTAALLATRYTVLHTAGNLNNEIGVPLTLLKLDDAIDFAVVEMGANHKGEIGRMAALARPTASAVTMVAPAHLEGFGTLDDIERAKGEIAEQLPADGVFFENVDDERCRRIAQRTPARKVRWGHSGEYVLHDVHFDEAGELNVTIDPIGTLRLPLPFRAHARNVALACAVAHQHGVTEFEAPLRAACGNMARFRVRQVGGLTVLDDSYNANPTSMAAALEALAARPTKGKRYAALGAMLELGADAAAYHRTLGEQAAAAADVLYAYGPHAEDTVAGARATGQTEAYVFAEHAAIAADVAERTQPGDVLLLKGSRGMRMEQVLAALEQRQAVEDGPE